MNVQGPSVAVVGSIIVDLAVTIKRVPRRGENLLAEEFRMGPGGKGANAAAAMARLGARSLLVGSVGDDHFARVEREGLAQAGVDLSCVHVDPDSQTGIALIMVDGQGENTILVVLGANGSLDPAASLARLADRWDGLDAILVDYEVPEAVVRAVLEEARKRRVPSVLDAGPPRSWGAETWRAADVVSPNRLEIEAMAGRALEREEDLIDAAAQIVAQGPRAVVIKRGAEGALICRREGSVVVPAFAVDVVDTTGAGDAFSAALTVGIARGMPLDDATRQAAAAGALAVTRFGTMPAMPDAEELQRFLRGRAE